MCMSHDEWKKLNSISMSIDHQLHTNALIITIESHKVKRTRSHFTKYRRKKKTKEP